ncbi:PREDICTED: zinc finger BED domain-containing protein RICESLEEPER 2-like [Camelina sativa]|uniref:Zinc finger BED domain-containing protein RICESLEEPER 2-like n=1 Tax=Camelina sativa TaxID=90675 RepID=A0ABM0SL43_CAMSA|nr:PREDICTED: zinc finger BED domain-containing protein RICESLEEPER 2-like [Camelina sativa]
MGSSNPVNEVYTDDELNDEEEMMTPRPRARGKRKQTQGSGSGGGTTAEQTKTPRTLAPRSGVWTHFTRLAGSRNRCKCNYCGKELRCSTKSGTKNLWNHLKICKAYKAWEEGQDATGGQQVINKEGNIQYAKVPEHVFREALNQMLVNLYKPHSRRTATRDIVKMYVERKATLRQWFLANNQRVSLTTDIWVSSVTCSSYMVITSHYIDKQWRLKKLIIGFKNVGDHKGTTIANTLLECLAEWGIEKVFSVTVDNATVNSNALSQFQSSFSEVSNDSLVIDGDFMHLRCAGHIINLIVKDGLTEIDASVVAVCNGISYVRSGPNRRKAFQQRVENGRFSKGSMPLDVCTRWNSTYLMLTRAIKFKGAFDKMEFEDKLYNDHFLETVDGVKRIGPPLSQDWRKIERLVKFLNVFYKATLVVSASTTMNAHQCYGEIVNIAVKLQLLCATGDSENINRILIIVSVMDPRKKMQFANLCFEELYGVETVEAKAMKDSVNAIMRDMYSDRYAEATAYAEQTQSHSSSQSNRERHQDLFDSDDVFDGYNPMEQKYDTLLKTIGVRDNNELDTYMR